MGGHDALKTIGNVAWSKDTGDRFVKLRNSFFQA